MSTARLVRRAAVAVFAALAVGLAAQPASAQEAAATGLTTEIIVSLEPGAALSDIVQSAGAVSSRKVPYRPDLAVLRVPALAGEAVQRALSARPDVAFAAPNATARIALKTNDPMLNVRQQWHLMDSATVRGSANWTPVGSATLGSGATVAVLDTGVTAHPDIDGILPGHDFVSNDTDASDPHGHGTHVAGTIAETADNSLGVAGVAPGASILPVRVLGDNGEAPYEVIFSGMAYAVAQGADVINMSLAGDVDSGMCAAVTKAVTAGVSVIAATGNAGGPVGFPAACPDAIAVGAVTKQGAIAAYSNRGPEVDLAAPGGSPDDVDNDSEPDGILQYSVFRNSATGLQVPGFYYSSGTSMASPHVAGAAAIIRSVRPAATPAQVREVLTKSVTDLGTAGTDQSYGAGLLDVAKVVSGANALSASAPPPTAPAPPPTTIPDPTTTTTTRPSTTTTEPTRTTTPPSTTTSTTQPTTTPTTATPGQSPTSTTSTIRPRTSTTTSAPPMTTAPPSSPTDDAPPSEQSPNDPAGVERLSGADRFATAAGVSADRFSGGSEHVWLATGASFADALSTGAAAGRRGGPLLLVEGCGMPSSTAAELSRLDPAAITVVGGPAAVCDGVLEHARSITGVQPSRVAGVDRFDTAAALSRTFWAGGSPTVLLASAAGFADSLGGGALGAEEDAPLLLSAACDLPAATADELARLRPSSVVVMGGRGAVCDAVLERVRSLTGATVSRISGVDRFATAAAASARGWQSGSPTVFIASGQGFADGLSAGVAAAADDAPLLLVPACGTLPVDVRNELQRLGTAEAFAVGGPSAVCADMLDQVSAAL